MKVAIIYNHDVSGVINSFGIQNKEFYTKKNVDKVAQSLEKAGHNVTILDGNKQIIDRIENFMPRVIENEQMGMVFNMAYGIQGESRYTHIPSMLEMLGVPYVGSSPAGHAVALDKVLTKIIWKNCDLPTPEFWVFNSVDEDMSKVKYPVIVKPKMESVSFGLKVVDNIDDLREAVDFIVSEFQQQALVEQFIRGREFCVGIIGNSPVETFPVLEIDLEGDPDAIQTVTDKKEKPKRKLCPAPLSDELSKRMQELSIEAFKALNLRDFARVDIRLDENDNIYLLEINSMASLGETGSYPTAAKVAGYDFSGLVNRMLDVASVRYFSKSQNLVVDDKQKKIPQHTKQRVFLKTRTTYIEKFLKNIVNRNSYLRNLDGVNSCINSISSEFSQLGFISEVYPQVEVGNIVYFSNSQDSKVDFLILLSIDNRVTLSDHENFSETDQYLEGSGIWENKGGIAVTLSALQALKYSRLLKKIKIGILITTDSTINGKYSKDILIKKSKSAKRVISINGSEKSGGIVTSRSGSAIYRYEIKMIDKGCSENISLTAAAFNKALAQISDISKNDSENLIAPYNITYNSNIFRQTAYGSAGISVRFNNLDEYNLISEKVKKVVSSQRRSKIYNILFEGGMKRPPMVETDRINSFYKDVKNLADKIDVRVIKEHRWSSSEICHITEDIERLDGLGPVGEFLNSGNERILRHTLVERGLLLAQILQMKE